MVLYPETISAKVTEEAKRDEKTEIQGKVTSRGHNYTPLSKIVLTNVTTKESYISDQAGVIYCPEGTYTLAITVTDVSGTFNFNKQQEITVRNGCIDNYEFNLNVNALTMTIIPL